MIDYPYNTTNEQGRGKKEQELTQIVYDFDEQRFRLGISPKQEYVEVKPIGYPLGILFTLNSSHESLFSDLNKLLPRGADAFCLGSMHENNVLERRVPVQFYQIQKPFWQKVQSVLRDFWKLEEMEESDRQHTEWINPPV